MGPGKPSQTSSRSPSRSSNARPKPQRTTQEASGTKPVSQNEATCGPFPRSVCTRRELDSATRAVTPRPRAPPLNDQGCRTPARPGNPQALSKNPRGGNLVDPVTPARVSMQRRVVLEYAPGRCLVSSSVATLPSQVPFVGACVSIRRM